MSIIDHNQLVGISLFETVPAEAGNVHPDPNGLFNDYLHRAQYSTADTGNNSTNNPGKNADQPSVPRAEESRPATESPSLQNGSEDDINSAESDGKKNSPESKIRQSENKSEPVERDQAASQTEKKKNEDDKEKDKLDGRDAQAVGKIQDNQPNAQINPAAADAKSRSQSGEESAAREVELKEAANPLQAASKDAKIIAEPGTLTKAGSLKETTSQTAVVEEGDASVSPPIKGKASKKTSLGNEEKAGISSAEKQADETISASGEGGTSAIKMSKDKSLSTRDLSRRSSHQNDKKESSTTRVADATVSPADSQEASAGAPTVNSAALQAVVNAPTTLMKPEKTDVDVHGTTVGSGNNADGSAKSPLQIAPASTNTAAGTSQRDGNETGSQFDRVRFVQRVEQAFAAIGDRGGSVRLKLNPPELGSLRMEITVRKGEMKARVETDTKEAKNLLLENLPALRDRLAQQNIKIHTFDVDLRDPSLGGMPQQTAHQSDSGSREGGYRNPRPQVQEKTVAAAPAAGTTRLADHSGQLNVIV